MAGKGKYYESQFEEATIELLRESHWQYTFGDDIHRKYTDPLIEEDLRTFLAAQYKDKKLTASEVDGIVPSCSIATDMILHTVMAGIIRSACNTSTSSIPTIIFSVASTNLSWNKAVRTVGPTFCFL